MKKILIVDDEQDIVESLKFVLEVSGFVCYTAFNGEDGLRLAKEIMPDLIILDVMMPKINGYKISRLLKYDNKYKDIPIIMVTARSQLEDKMIGEETGVNEYITKPFELDQIVKKVEEYLGGGVNGGKCMGLVVRPTGSMSFGRGKGVNIRGWLVLTIGIAHFPLQGKGLG